MCALQVGELLQRCLSEGALEGAQAVLLRTGRHSITRDSGNRALYIAVLHVTDADCVCTINITIHVFSF